jgi:isopentenyl-diphosphate delta-isomerase
MKQPETVVLVDTQGQALLDPDGTSRTMAKMEAHRQGLLHLAVSVFIFNSRDELLLQQRAPHKYHSPDKWTNTCCTHPRPGESPLATAQRRLFEEMGLKCPLYEVFTFLYRAEVGNGLIENEFDHVFMGFSNLDPRPDPAEVGDWKWISIEELKRELAHHPEAYSPWIGCCFDKVAESLPRVKVANRKPGAGGGSRTHKPFKGGGF